MSFPSHGPFDERLGYTRIPKYRHMLERFGFRVVGRRERIGQLHGIWRDVVFLERRSEVVV